MNDPSLHKLYYKSGSSYQELFGVNNLSLSKSTSFSEQYLLGGIYSATQVNAPEQVDLSFDRSFINYDDILQYTGTAPLNDIYIYNGFKFYYIKDAYLNSYSAGFSVGELPRISTKFISYGSELLEASSIPSMTSQAFPYDVPKLGSIFLNGTDSNLLTSIHNIFSFDYSLEINRQVFFSIGSKAAQICPILPIKINFSLNSKLKSETDSLSNSFSKIAQKNYNFDISISGAISTMSFPIRNAQLVSSEITMSSNNTLEVKRQFLGYYGL